MDAVGRQRSEIDPLDAPRTIELAQQRAQLPQMLVGANRGEQAHAVRGPRSHQEGEEVAGRRVAPVKVLDCYDDLDVLAGTIERRHDRLEDPRLAGRTIGPP